MDTHTHTSNQRLSEERFQTGPLASLLVLSTTHSPHDSQSHVLKYVSIMSLSYEHLLTASHILRIKSRLLTRLCLSWPLPTSLTSSPTNLFLVHIDLAILAFVPPWAHVKLVATLGPLQLALAFAWNPLPRSPRGCPFLLTQVFPKCGPTKRPSWSQDLRLFTTFLPLHPALFELLYMLPLPKHKCRLIIIWNNLVNLFPCLLPNIFPSRKYSSWGQNLIITAAPRAVSVWLIVGNVIHSYWMNELNWLEQGILVQQSRVG